MKLDIDKSSKVTEPDFWKKIWFRGYGPKRGQNGPNSDPFQFFSRCSLTIFLVFCMQIDFYKGLILHQTACSAKFRFQCYGPKRGQNGPNSDPSQIFVIKSFIKFPDVMH